MAPAATGLMLPSRTAVLTMSRCAGVSLGPREAVIGTSRPSKLSCTRGHASGGAGRQRFDFGFGAVFFLPPVLFGPAAWMIALRHASHLRRSAASSGAEG